MDARDLRKHTAHAVRPADPTAPRELERAIEAATRCWLLHRWSPWTLYETVRPAGGIGRSHRHGVDIAELRRRRHCVRCGKRDDRYVGQRSAHEGQ